MQEKLWRKNLIQVTPYVAGEQSKEENVVKLNANENPYPPSPRVQEVLQHFDAASFRKYPEITAGTLKKAIAGRYGLKEEQVFVGNGSDDVLALAFRAFFNSEKPILYPDITYSFYPVWCDLLKIPCETIPLQEDFTMNVRDYDKPNGGVVLTNPNAPTSIGVGEAFIRDLLEHNQDCIVIVDEAYVDFGGYSALPLLEEYDNLVIVQTYSKSRSLAGMRVGMAFASPELVGILNGVKDSYNSYPLDSMAMALAKASMEDEDYFQEITGKIIATREWIKTELEKLGFDVKPSSTNFLFVTHPTIPAKDLFTYLKEEKKVFIRYFDKPRISNHLRITIGTPAEMEQLLAGIRDYQMH